MDTGEYETNTLLLNNISSIAYSFYEPPSEQSHTFASVALTLETELRQQGHLVTYDTTRRAICHFRIVGKEAQGDGDDRRFPAALHASGHGLLQKETGTFEPSSLQRVRFPGQAGNQAQGKSGTAAGVDQTQRNAPGALNSLPNAQKQEAQSASTSTEAKGAPSQNSIIYEQFITSVLLTLVTALCKQSGATPLNYRTILLPSKQKPGDGSGNGAMQSSPALGTFRAYLTTAGALVISLHVVPCKGLECSTVSGSLPGQQVLAAPFGVLARNPAALMGDGGMSVMAQTPATQTLSHRAVSSAQDSLWKKACLKVLEQRGIDKDSLQRCSWCNLQVPKRSFQDSRAESRRSLVSTSAMIPWPGPLVFLKKTLETPIASRVGDAFLSGHEESHDPLAAAEGWFTAAGEREEKVAKRKTDRKNTQGDPMALDPRPSKATGQSPMAFRRPSTAAGAMYLTPPDGVQNPNGVTPSFDGTISSPANPTFAAAVDVEGPLPSSAAAPDNFDDVNVFPEPKRDRSESNVMGDTDDMFEDMGGDMFGDNDITEADFSFFDEEPDGMDMDLDLDKLAAAGSAPSKAKTKLVEAGPKAEEEPKEPIRDIPAKSKDEDVFAKPEVKHARSSQNTELIPRAQEPKRGSMKRERSPFDPDTVFKRVCASMSFAPEMAASGSRRKSKIFERVEFGPKLPMINKKYEQGGLYDYGRESKADEEKRVLQGQSNGNYYSLFGRQKHELEDGSVNVDALVRTFSGLEPPTAPSSPVKLRNMLFDTKGSDSSSDLDDSSYTSDEPISPVKPQSKAPVLEDDVVSQVTSLRDQEPSEEPDQHLAVELPRLAKPDAPELLLADYFKDPEPVASNSSLTDEELVQVAQLLTEQAALGNLDICDKQSTFAEDPLAKQSRQLLGIESQNLLSALQDSASSLLGEASQTRFKGYLDVADIPYPGQQPNRLQPRAVPGRDPNSENLRPSNLYQIPGPHLEVRRADTKLSTLPSAVTFWESLGLAPTSGGKDVNAVCVFPGWEGMADSASVFLERVKSVYEVLKLGMFDRLPLPGDTGAGILPFDVNRISPPPDATMTDHGSTLVDSMESLRSAMATLTATETNVVVFFAYSPTNPGSMVEACAAFQRFFDSYQKQLMSRREPAQNELVLQLVSIDTLSSPTSLVVTPPADLIKLCMETYDRCTLFTGPMPAPAIRLEQAIPRLIDFKVTNTPSASLVNENSCIHVAYARSVDDRWVTAAWTDDRGNQQATASYCLGRRGRPLSTGMNEVAHEIWESTLELISVWKVHWRVIITKCSPMDQGEVDFWVDLTKTESKASVTMVLMTVNTSPSLQLIPPSVKVAPPPVSFYSTPVSTPQANIVSPEQSGNPATPHRDGHSGMASIGTPGAAADSEPDADSTLVDITDQTWGAIVGHRLSNTTTILEIQPALLSGYLIKRTGVKIEDPPVLMEVSLVHTEAGPRAYETLFREMMAYFRGLGTLARARGVTDREGDVRPWHVAAAEKGVRALYMLM